MNRLRVKLYSPHVPASAVPRFAVRAAHSFGEHCDRTPGIEVTVTAGAADDAGAWLPWPVARCSVVPIDQLRSDPTGAATYAALLGDESPPFDVLFLPHPWKSFPAGRLSANPAPLVAYVSDLDFDDVDLGSVTDARRETAELIARDCATVVFASEGLRDRMSRRYGIRADRSAVVRPAASLSEVPTDAEAIGRELGLPNDFVVCFEATGRNAEDDLADVLRARALAWPVVVLGEPPAGRRPKGVSPEAEPTASGRLIRLSFLSTEAYQAVIALSRAVVAFTASPAPFFDSQHLDAMVLRKPLFCQTTGGNWEGGEPGVATFFRSASELARQLDRLRDCQLDRARLDAAERHARSRSEADQARELFDVFRSAHEAPLRGRIRFRTGESVCRERRIAWLCNHAALHSYEIPLIRSLGFEVYTPKQTPGRDFRSGAVAFADDEFSTLPRWVIERLNRHNFYEDELPEDLVSILNSYFGTVFISSWGTMVREMAFNFRGRILVRAFGREHPVSYHSYWDNFGGQELWDRIAAIGHRFWLAPPYDSIGPYEPDPLRSLSITLPLGVADNVTRNGGAWTGTCEKVLFVCPSINDSPDYYGRIHRNFKYHFGDLPHLIAGSQKKPVDDPHVVGYLAEMPYRRLLNDLRVMYYHSREPRHLHYHPLEAIVQGMPVVYLTGGLMEQFGGPDQPGACDTEADARRKLRRVLAGDRELIESIRTSQVRLLEAFSEDFVRREWEEKFLGVVMSRPLTPDTVPPAQWMRRRPPNPPSSVRFPRPRTGDLKVGVYLRAIPGGGVFNYATTLAKKLVETEQGQGRLEMFLGRRTPGAPVPDWPFERHPRLKVHRIRDREYLPGVSIPRRQPTRVSAPDAADSSGLAATDPQRPLAEQDGWRKQVKERLRPVMRRLREVRTDHPAGWVRSVAAATLAGLYYGRGAVAQRTLRPRGTGAALVLRYASGPEPAPLTYEQVREIAGRNDVTFFAYPYDLIAADTPLERVEELPVVAVMYDLAHEFSLSWGRRNYTIHREMHIWAKLARMIVFGSDAVRREAVRRYDIPIEKTTVVTVPPLVPRQDPPSAEESANVRRRLGLPQEYILNLGYQGPHKNNVVLLEAIRLLRWRGVRVPPLVLAGPDARRFVFEMGDAYADKIRSVIAEAGLIEGRDFFVRDYIAPEDVPGLYGGAAACVSMSCSEAQIHGMILEAMLYKRPLVCSDIPCNVEQLGTEDEYARLVPADDPAALADALADLFKNPAQTQHRVAQAHEWVKRLSWEPVLAEYRRVLAVAAGRPSEIAVADDVVETSDAAECEAACLTAA